MVRKRHAEAGLLELSKDGGSTRLLEKYRAGRMGKTVRNSE